jgi:hypothetical protein
VRYEVPEIVDLGSIADHTFMPVPPGCGPGGHPCVSHKGFFNANTPDGSDSELSHGVTP